MDVHELIQKTKPVSRREESLEELEMGLKEALGFLNESFLERYDPRYNWSRNLMERLVEIVSDPEEK